MKRIMTIQDICSVGKCDALTLAVDFTLECMKLTVADPESRFYGVNFEEALPMYISRIYGKN